MTTKNFQTDIITAFISNDGDKSIEISKTGLSLKRDLLTIPKETIITPLDITDVNTSNSISFDNLTYLPIGLGALEAPPNLTTLHIQDTILIDKLLNDFSNTLTNDNITILNNSTSETVIIQNNSISNNSTLNPFIIQKTGGQNLNIQFDTNIIIDAFSQGDIELTAPNINSYGYSMPICFDILTINRTVNYASGGQIWLLAWVENANLPKYFFTENPLSSYTSSNWRIDFTINTWNNGSQNNSSDKGLAYYIEFEDQNSNIYTPIMFNSITPFCCHNNNSTWSGGGSITEFQPFTWMDYVDFSGLIGTSSSNLPLKINLYCAFDNPKDFTFNMKVGLTRTNILP